MSPEYWPVLVLLLAVLIALPALGAMRRRRHSRECSEVALLLGEFAASLRRSQALDLDAGLLARTRRLEIPEMLGFDFARELTRPNPQLLADAAQRLALRLKRRVAFERKMLARTAPGRWRGAVAGSVAALTLLGLSAAGVVLPASSLVLVIGLQGVGCCLLWRVAHVAV